MSTPVRYDEQYCPIARALDALGDRWTILVLRELASGEQRYTDVKRALPGISPSVLSARLQQVVEQELVCEVPSEHGTRMRYALTDRGRSVLPVLRSLTRFGMDLLEDPAEAEGLDPRRTVQACLVAYFDPVAAEEVGVDERYLIRTGDVEITLSATRGPTPPKPPVLVVEADPSTLFALRQGRVRWEEAVRTGAMTVSGPQSAVRRMRRVFTLTR